MNKFFVFFSAFLCCLILFTGNVSAAGFLPEGVSEIPISEYLVDENIHDISVTYCRRTNNSIYALVAYNTSTTALDGAPFELLHRTLNSGEKIVYFKSLHNDTYYYSFYWNTDYKKWSKSVGPTNLVKGMQYTAFDIVDTVLYTDTDVLDYDTREVVFPAPLPVVPTLEEVVTEGVNNLQAETVGTMGTLTIIAVGLLALLIGLVILPKVLYRFL